MIEGRRRGFALIGALWLLVGIAGVLAALGVWAHDRRSVAVAVLEQTEAMAAAEAGLQHVRARLARLLRDTAGMGWLGGVADPWAGAPGVISDTVAGIRYRAHVSDVAAKLALNGASEAELTRFFQALGEPDHVAAQLAARIADWRDPDADRRVEGAEVDDYLQAGAPILPRNARFDAVEELRHVMGIDEATYERAAPHLSVTGDGRIDIHTATRPVLLALRGFTEEVVVIRDRRIAQVSPFVSLLDIATSLSPAARDILEPELPAIASRVTLAIREVDVQVEGRLIGSSSRAVLRVVLGHSAGEIYTRDWRWAR